MGLTKQESDLIHDTVATAFGLQSDSSQQLSGADENQNTVATDALSGAHIAPKRSPNVVIIESDADRNVTGPRKTKRINTEHINARISPEEMRIVDNVASCLHVSRSDALRSIINAYQARPDAPKLAPPSQVDLLRRQTLRDATVQLRKAGVLLNQAIAKLRAQSTLDADDMQWLADLMQDVDDNAIVVRNAMAVLS